MWSKVQLIGYLGSDPQLKYLETGVAVCDFTVATSRKYTRSDGSQVDETIWWDVTVWGDQAENAYKYLGKGKPVFVEGRMKPDENGYPRTYIRADGSCGARYELTARDVRYLPDGGKRVASTEGTSGDADSSPSWNPDDLDLSGIQEEGEVDENGEFVF